MMGLSACGGGGSTNQFVSAPSEGDGSGGGGGTGGTISNAGIYISVATQEQAVTTALHKFYNYDVPCSVPANASSSQDIECLLNIRELDLFSQGLKLEFNVPAGMCDYIGDTPYWFYNRPAGYGPTSVTVTVDDQASTSSCTYKGNDGVSHAGTMSGHMCTFPGGTATVEGGTTCDYDYTASGGPNCCQGAAILSTNYTTSGGTFTSAVDTKAWGGSIGLCAAGPYLPTGSGWIYNATSGYPYTQVRTGLAGFNQYYKIAAPLYLGSADNAYAANFWDWADYASGSHPTSTLPLPMKYSTDALGNTLPRKANPSYTFLCYDASMEVKHRIRLYINEWDKSIDFLNYMNAATRATANPDATGTCDVDDSAEDCDDIPGWNLYQSLYPTSFPGYDLSNR